MTPHVVNFFFIFIFLFFSAANTEIHNISPDTQHHHSSNQTASHPPLPTTRLLLAPAIYSSRYSMHNLMPFHCIYKTIPAS